MTSEGLAREDFADISIDELSNDLETGLNISNDENILDENGRRYVFVDDEIWREITRAPIAASSMKKMK